MYLQRYVKRSFVGGKIVEISWAVLAKSVCGPPKVSCATSSGELLATGYEYSSNFVPIFTRIGAGTDLRAYDNDLTSLS